MIGMKATTKTTETPCTACKAENLWNCGCHPAYTVSEAAMAALNSIQLVIPPPRRGRRPL